MKIKIYLTPEKLRSKLLARWTVGLIATYFVFCANALPAQVINFDVPGGIGGFNYSGQGVHSDPGKNYWNPVVGNGTTPIGFLSDGTNSSPVTLTNSYQNIYAGDGQGPQGTPGGLQSPFVDTKGPVETNVLHSVSTGTYDLYLYGINGGMSDSDRGTTFTAWTDLTSPTTLSTSNSPSSYTAFIQGNDYVVFHNLTVGAAQTIFFTYKANTAVTSPHYSGANAEGIFNGLQLVTISSSATVASITNSSATNIQTTSASLGGTLANGGSVPKVTIYYGPNDGGTNAASWSNSVPLGYITSGSFSQIINNLSPISTYYFTAAAVNSVETSWATPSQSFTTAPITTAQITNLPAASITANTALLGADVLDIGGGNTPVVTIFYGATDGGTNAANWANSISLGSLNGSGAQRVFNLSPNSTYYFTARASNNIGVSWATPSQSFTTQLTNATETVVYTNNFETSVGPEWSQQQTDVTPLGSRRFLGQFSNQVVRLTLSNLPPHTAARVTFQLYVILSWDGSDVSPGHGPDTFDLNIEGGPSLLHTTFSYDNPTLFKRQSYPDPYPIGDNLPNAGASEIGTLGYFYAGRVADAVYSVSYTFADTNNSIVIDFFGGVSQTIDNESWGIDNIQVSVGNMNIPPIVSIIQPPTSTASFAGPTNVTLQAGVTDDVAVTNVAFYASWTNLIGQVSSSPFAFTWTNAPLGYSFVRAVATDNNGLSTTSAPVGLAIVTNMIGGFHANINFQPQSAAIPSGYIADAGDRFDYRTNGWSYGWNIDDTANAVDRNATNSPDQRYDTFNTMQTDLSGQIWSLALPNGIYWVHLVAGDATQTDSTYKINVEDSLTVSGTPTTAQHWIEGTNIVQVTDGRLTLTSPTNAVNNKICFIDIKPLVEPQLENAKFTGTDFSWQVNGTTNQTYIVQASTDLNNWISISTNTVSTNLTLLHDPMATNGLRFYRLLLKP